MATIETTDGNEICAGLQGCDVCDEAIHAAQRHADGLQADVVLHDDDGAWLVHPAINGKREQAEDIDHLFAAD